jgi:hypothetical protein
MKLVLTIACCLFLVTNVWAQTKPAVAKMPTENYPTAGWKSYHDSTKGFALQYPTSWDADNTRENTPLFLFSPLKENDDFRENFNIQVGGGGGTLDEYIKLNINDLKSSIKNFKIISQRKLIYNGNSAFEIVFTGGLETVSFPLRWKQRYVLTDRGSFVVTYSTVAGKTDDHAATSDLVFKTFFIF